MTNSEVKQLMMDVSFVTHALLKKGFEKFDGYLKQGGLVRTHVALLYLLLGGEELSMSELSRELGVSKPNVTLLIDKLEKLGLVERVSSETDRRVSFIRISEQGKVSIAEYSNELAASFQDTLSCFSAEEVELFTDSIAALKSLLSKL